MRGDRRINQPAFSGDWQVLFSLVPYFLEFPLRVALAVVFLVASKLATVLLPIAMKYIVDSLDSSVNPLVVVPLALLLGYGALRFGTIALGEIRDTIFGRVTERAMRRIGLKVFRHLHQLDVGFHLARRTGGLARNIERGTNGISFLMRFMLFNILPTLLEIGLVATILAVSFNWTFPAIVVVAIVLYVSFSVVVTDWRTAYVREMNRADNQANTRAVDSLLNFETVKLFNNSEYEAREYDQNLADWEAARRHNRLSLAGLNLGQALVISGSMTLMMVLSAREVAAGAMTLGDLVMVNAYMMQLFIPLNFLGFVYREIKRALADIEELFRLLNRAPEVVDTADAQALQAASGRVEFDNVSFGYHPDRQILDQVSFTLEPNQKVAIVGPSGSGKSTIARLLFRLYDPDSGQIRIDGKGIETVTQDSLRSVLGIVPQDTVLFNNSIEYNIGYGRPGASPDQIRQVAAMAHLADFIDQLPEGYATVVGERGLKVSGGEKQRIAIARMLLKEPGIMVFDEATSSLDSSAERAILSAIEEVSSQRTALIIAHRLATVVNADRILVLAAGRLVESGTHAQLLAANGLYANMWALQADSPSPSDFANDTAVTD